MHKLEYLYEERAERERRSKEDTMRRDHAEQLNSGIVKKGLARRMMEGPLRALGIEPVPLWGISNHAHGFVHAELLQEVFAKQKIDCVFDVGAFNGHFGRILRDRVGFKGTIISFEPLPDAFKALNDWASRDPKWHAINAALGDKSGQLTMNVTNALWFSSFLAPGAETPKNMAARNTVETTISARVDTIAECYDALSRKHGFTRPFLKMDTQGYDVRVVEGAGSMIDKFLGLQSEMSVIPIYDGMPNWREALAQYEKRGFTLSSFFPVTQDESLRAVEMDVVMVRSQQIRRCASPAQHSNNP